MFRRRIWTSWCEADYEGEEMSIYPEHEKLRARQYDASFLSGFIDFIAEQGWELAEFDDTTERLLTVRKQPDEIIGMFLGIDPKKTGERETGHARGNQESSMTQRIPRGLYDEALSTYENLRPTTETSRYAFYDLSDDDWSHLLYMARAHLEGQVTGANNEDDQVGRCKRYLKQLAVIEGNK